jgi:hypothetical protein
MSAELARAKRWFITLLTASALACKEDPPPAQDAIAADVADDAAVDAAADATSAADAFALQGSNVDVARNPSCDKFDDGVYGKKLAWSGWQGGGQTFSCNTCRGGYPNLQGSWRFIDFKTEDPSTPLAKSYKEVLKFDGNTLTNHLQESDAGQASEQRIDGWYFCTDAAELKAKDALFVLERAVPQGLFGNKSGDFFRVSVKINAGSDDLIALGVYSGLSDTLLGEYLYCRIGSSVAGKACSDPFGG